MSALVTVYLYLDEKSWFCQRGKWICIMVKPWYFGSVKYHVDETCKTLSCNLAHRNILTKVSCRLTVSDHSVATGAKPAASEVVKVIVSLHPKSCMHVCGCKDSVTLETFSVNRTADHFHGLNNEKKSFMQWYRHAQSCLLFWDIVCNTWWQLLESRHVHPAVVPKR